MNWFFIAMSVSSLVLGFERLWRLSDDPPTLTNRAMLSALFILSAACAAYGTMGLTASFHNLGLGLWHTLLGVLIGSLEMVVLTLRQEEVTRRAVRGVIARSAVVTLVLLLTWLPAFGHQEPMRRIDFGSLRDWALIVHLLVFHAYIIWGLMQVVLLSLNRLPRDIRRRPISTAALLMMATGCIGFVWVNLVIAAELFKGRAVGAASTVVPTSVLLALCVGGAGLLAVGERVHEEITARYQLRRLNPLWWRMMELSTQDLRLPTGTLSSPARLQRAYVEISDAICTLRVDTEGQLGVPEVVEILRRGELTQDRQAPTISEALPPRRTRREDLELIHALARAYR